MKNCSLCQVAKPLSEFHRDSHKKDGHVKICKPCACAKSRKWCADNQGRVRARRKAYYAANQERAVAYSQQWKENNREKTNAWAREWNAKNKDKVREKVSRWQRNNPGKVLAANGRRRAACVRATPLWGRADLIERQYALARMLGLSVDHIVPLNSPLVCGLHVHYNLQLIPLSENVRKSNRQWPDMP